MTVIVECPRCHREVARLKAGHGDRAFIAGSMTTEADRARAESPGGPRPASYVFNVDPVTDWPSQPSTRVKLVCNRRGHRDPKPSRVVTQEALNASYHRLIAQGIERVSWQELHA